MPQCQAKVNNKICGKPLEKRDAKYCEEHKNYKPPVTSKASTGMGYGDTPDKNTGKKQSHTMQPKGGLRH